MLIAGMNKTNTMNDAIDWAKSAESHWPRSMQMPDGQFVMTYDSGEKAPDNEVLGPVTPRGGHAGIVYQGDKKLAEWGDVDNADMRTNSTRRPRLRFGSRFSTKSPPSSTPSIARKTVSTIRCISREL